MEVHVGEGIDTGAAWHFGNPAAEAGRIASGEGIAVLAHREVVEITGEDRLQFLHLITTQRFEGLPPGTSVHALVLNAQGHIMHALNAVDDGARLLGWTEPGRAGALIEHVQRMRFAMRVEARPREDLTLHWVGDAVQADGVRVDCEFGGAWLCAPAPLTGDVGLWALEAARIGARVPRVFVDTDERTIPNEIGLFGTALDKGCYPGQETVAKVHTLGRPPRRLVLLHLDGSVSSLPAPGSELTLAGKVVGRVGSSSLHHELGPIALALVKRNVAVDAQLEADGIAAAQETVVDPDVGLHIRPLR